MEENQYNPIPESTSTESQNPEFQSRIDMTALKNSLDRVKAEINKVIVGQDSMIEHLLVALLSNGHVLIEGVPGVAKTITAKLLAKTIAVDFSRIQFTPDLMPSDILGTAVFNAKTTEFEFKKGPIFSNFILIDEINRSPAKTQAALFEVMEERQITMDGRKYIMEEPFLVIATQNPIEQEGTYRLPEAQLDRFLFKVNVGYPTPEQEVQIIKNQHQLKVDDKTKQVQPVLTAEELKTYSRLNSFKIGFRNSFKIFVSTIPFTIFAGILEGFVTRYALQMPLIIDLVIIFGTLGFIIFYYAIFPYRVHKKLKHDAIL